MSKVSRAVPTGIIHPRQRHIPSGSPPVLVNATNWSPVSALACAKLAGNQSVAVVIREIPTHRLLEITLIENIQREDLNPIETAVAFDGWARTPPQPRSDRTAHR